MKRAFAVISLVAACGAVGTPFAGARESWILETVQSERSRAGVAPLDRRSALDRVAAERAARIAELPHSRRLSLDEPIAESLRVAGIRRFARASVHMEMLRGYRSPSAGFLMKWQAYEQAWSRVISAEYDAVGLATHTASDGWIILVVVILEDLPPIDPPGILERRTFEAVNEIRAENGLEPLTFNATLASVARDHSRDMAVRDYFDHRSPDGKRPWDRIRPTGLRYNRLDENIQMNRGAADPVRRAVESWMGSRGHRKAILNRGSRETGVGVAIDEDSTIYFTQLFIAPSSRSARPPAVP